MRPWLSGAPVHLLAEATAPDAVILSQIAVNARRPIPWLMPSEPHGDVAVIVGGGPSARGFVDEIGRREAAGQILFALNGAAQWLRTQLIVPDWQVILDARPENVRFVEDLPARNYLISSQCHPSLFVRLAGSNVVTFHPAMEGLAGRLPKGRMVCAISGDTCGLAAIALAATMGFRHLELYGYDSSHDEGKGHAYDQVERTDGMIAIRFGRKMYRCTPGMLKQAEAFPELASKSRQQGCSIGVHGYGLLPAMATEMMKDEVVVHS